MIAWGRQNSTPHRSRLNLLCAAKRIERVGCDVGAILGPGMKPKMSLQSATSRALPTAEVVHGLHQPAQLAMHPSLAHQAINELSSRLSSCWSQPFTASRGSGMKDWSGAVGAVTGTFALIISGITLCYSILLQEDDLRLVVGGPTFGKKHRDLFGWHGPTQRSAVRRAPQ
jgi:hypothetical protein